MGSFAFALAGQGTDTIELDVYSVIGESFWYDSISASAVRRQLKSNPDAKTVAIRINSDGGDIIDAQAIYTDLQEHPGQKKVTITGIAASAATLIAMAGDEIVMAEGAWFMIHDVWGGAQGSPEDLENKANLMRAASANYAKAYSARTGMPITEVSKLMAAETWMTAADAKARGFVDVIIPMNTKAKASARERMTARAALRSVAFAMNSGDYQNLPGSLREQLKALTPEQKPEPKDDLPQEEPETTMNMKAITQALNLIDGADETTIVGAINALKGHAAFATSVSGALGKSGDEGVALVGSLRAAASTLKSIETETGKNGDEALGTIQAWKKSAARVPELEAQIAEGKASAEQAELVALLKAGADEKKLTKAESDKLKARVEGGFKARGEKREPTAEEWSLAQAKAFVAALPVQPNFVEGHKAKSEGSSSTAILANADKAYEDMSPKERADLRSAEGGDALYAAKREDWERRGKPRKGAAKS